MKQDKYNKLDAMRDKIPQLNTFDLDECLESSEYPFKVICQMPYEGIDVTAFKTKEDANKYLKISSVIDKQYDWFGPYLIKKA